MAGSTALQAYFLPKRWLLYVEGLLGDGYDLRMVIDTGTFLSAISRSTEAELMGLGMLREHGSGRGPYLLRDIHLNGLHIPEVVVGVSERITAMGIAGLLGLNFLARFRRVTFDT